MYRSWNIKAGEKNHDSLKDSIVRRYLQASHYLEIFIQSLRTYHSQVLFYSLHLLPTAAAAV